MRTLYGASALLASAVLLGGCTTQHQWHNTHSPATITILTGSDTSIGVGNQHLQGDSGMYTHLANWWNKYEAPSQHFDIQFDVISGGATEEHSEMLAAAQSGDSGYDIFNLDNQWVSEFAAGGYIRPLDGRLDTAVFLPGPLHSAEDAAGHLYAVPFTTDVGLLYYRSDLVDKADRKAVNSYAGLIRVAEKALRGHPAGVTEGYVGQFDNYEGLTVNTLEAIWGHDSAAFGGNGSVTGPKATKAVAAGLSDLADAFIRKSGGMRVVRQRELTYEEPQAASDFASGDAVFMRNWPIWYPQLRAGAHISGAPEEVRIAEDVGVRPLPFPSALGGQDLAISSHSLDPGYALEAARFLTSIPAERCLFAVGGFPSTLKQAYSPGRPPITYDGSQVPLCGTDTGSGTSPIAGTILDALAGAVRRPTTPYYSEFSARLQSDVGWWLALKANNRPGPSASVEASALVKDLNSAVTGHDPPGGG